MCPTAPVLLLLVTAASLTSARAVSFKPDPDRSLSVLCTSPSATACRVQGFDALEWSARGHLVASSVPRTGWGTLKVEANPEVSDAVMSFGVGYVEGLLTPRLMEAHHANLEPDLVVTAAQRRFVAENDAWMRQMWNTAKQGDSYWAHIHLVWLQQEGLSLGYNTSRTGDSPFHPLSREDIQLMGLLTELGDIGKAVSPGSRPNYAHMSTEEFSEWVFSHSHCSALIKTTPDLTDVFTSHNTWTTYRAMLRLFKTVVLPLGETACSAPSVTFSGYPGTLQGIDDFYLTSQKLVVMETTNGVYNNSLFDLVVPTSVPYWMRVIVANRMASSGPEWHETFYRYNSGTYNNQWMTVDYKLVRPGQQLKPHTLWVSEQIPGTYVAHDQTVVLQRGHWPSYNVPFYPEVYSRSGYPAMVAQRGVNHSYQLAPRAQLFRRDADSALNFSEFKMLMRSNHYGEGDPLAPDADSAIAARADLRASDPVAGGAIDAKAVNVAMAQRLQVAAVAGPTTEGQPAFSWTGTWANWTLNPHYGQPTTFDFPWVVFNSTMESKK